MVMVCQIKAPNDISLNLADAAPSFKCASFFSLARAPQTQSFLFSAPAFLTRGLHSPEKWRQKPVISAHDRTVIFRDNAGYDVCHAAQDKTDCVLVPMAVCQRRKSDGYFIRTCPLTSNSVQKRSRTTRPKPGMSKAIRTA